MSQQPIETSGNGQSGGGKTPAWIIYWRLIPALFWMTIIFLFSNQPGGGSGKLSKIVMGYLASFGLNFQAWFGDHALWMVRKLAHFTEYAILFFLVSLALTAIWPSKPWRKRMLPALLITVLYAASDEFHQLFIPGRVGDILDVGIDSLGACFAMLFLSLVLLLIERRRSRRSAN